MPPAKSSFVRDCDRYSAEPEAIAASASDEQTEAAFLGKSEVVAVNPVRRRRTAYLRIVRTRTFRSK